MFNALLSLIIIGLQGYTIFLLQFKGSSELGEQNIESEMAKFSMDSKNPFSGSKKDDTSSDSTKTDIPDLSSKAPQLPNPSKFANSLEKDANSSKAAENPEKEQKPSSQESSLLSHNESFNKASLGSSSLLKK